MQSSLVAPGHRARKVLTRCRAASKVSSAVWQGFERPSIIASETSKIGLKGRSL